MRPRLSLLAAAVLLAACLLMPRIAFASAATSSGVTQCSESLLTPEIDMNMAESDDCVVDADDPRTVPLCLDAGASAVAPLIIHAIGDARIEAAKTCSSYELPGEVNTPSDKAPGERSEKAPHAALPPLPAIPVFDAPMISAPLSSDEAVLNGHRGGVYRPPRA